jgi:glyoxylase-like metal-dependent hydrolase (beta-lactamase superfamily II)
MRRARCLLLLALALPLGGQTPHPGFRKLLTLTPGGEADLHVWSDTTNVYVLRDGGRALLIDLGDGSVLDHLPSLGVRQVEWVLFTHHHREQTQGYRRLRGSGARIGAPLAERELFESPSSFRKFKPSLSDRFAVHGSSYVRPGVEPIPVDRAFARMDDFTWRGFSFHIVETKGNSPGSLSYLLLHDGGWLAFSGDVMLDGARMHNWFDTEWDYGFAAGIYALHESAALLERYGPRWLFPAHGPAIANPASQLAAFRRKLETLEKLYVRGYPVFRFSGAMQDRVSRPTAIPHVWQVSPHLYKFKGPNFYPNFYLLLAPSGRALAIDCGLLDHAFLDQAIERMQRQLGLKQIDACVITHMHGDHMLEAEHLRAKWGAQVWALDRMAGPVEHPEHYDYAAALHAYPRAPATLKIDRLFRDGETFTWEGYSLTVDWMPGQTEFALALRGQVDGRHVVFTGDNLFGDPLDPAQSGHEAVVARNSAILEEGYIYGAEYLRRIQPDLILGGHSYVMDQPAGLIERYRTWAYELRAALADLSSDPDYRYWFDPYWVRAEPYRLRLRRGQEASFTLHVRNFRPEAQTHRIAVHAPEGWTASPAAVEGALDAAGRKGFPVRLRAPESASPGVAIVAFDVTLDGKRYGEWFDLIVEVE